MLNNFEKISFPLKKDWQKTKRQMDNKKKKKKKEKKEKKKKKRKENKKIRCILIHNNSVVLIHWVGLCFRGWYM